MMLREIVIFVVRVSADLIGLILSSSTVHSAGKSERPSYPLFCALISFACRNFAQSPADPNDSHKK